MNFPKLSKIFKTSKSKAPENGVAVGTSQKPKANSQKPSIHAAGINVSTAGDVSGTAQNRVAPPPSGVSFNDVIKFLARYLHCSDHQRNLLALWILHSHCFSASDFTPYLSVHSTKAQSGKTRCLQLLSLLCPNPALTASFATNNLSSRIHYSEQRPTFLLDQCHATVGSRRRSKNPVLRAILASGFQRGIGHTDRKGERVLFSLKAFAGIGLLPEDLAERSIPIHLERLTPSIKLQNFRSEAVEAEAEPLRQWLAFWGQQNLQKLKSALALDPEDFPSGIALNPRRKDLIEPLLQIARLLAGPWPKRAADALTAIFQDQVQRERKHALALLYELREAFSHYGQPARIATASLLVWLHHQPDAPWNQEGLISANRLADILRPFNIRPRQQRKKGESNHRGYTMQDFLYTWDQLLPREPAMNRDTSRREPMPSAPKPIPADEASLNAFRASEPQPPGSPTRTDVVRGGVEVQRQVLPNKNAAGINVSTTSAVSVQRGSDEAKQVSASSESLATRGPLGRGERSESNISANQRESAAEDSGVAVGVPQRPLLGSADLRAEPSVTGAEKFVRNSGHLSGGERSDKTNDPRLKGILDDPYNYYRQYPDEHKAELLRLIKYEHRWPQPADDKLKPTTVYRMPDGTRIPFTTVNRPPRIINALPDFQTERWPVMLEEKERLQVAVARFYELHTAAKAAMEQKQREASSNREQVSYAVS